MFVPVVDKSQNPLMPTKPSRARRWIKSGKATPFLRKGLFCIRLNFEPSSMVKQEVAVGIDPGSKKEAFSIKSAKHTYINLQADAITWVSNAVKTRREMRKGRRFRKTPCRQPRANRRRGGIPPSTKSRWGWKLRIAYWLSRLYPISMFVVEDVKATTKGRRKWDKSFSPLEVGKTWFYKELSQLTEVKTMSGWETKLLRDHLGLKKSGDKLADVFESHAVDSWVLASSEVGGKVVDNKCLLLIRSLQFHRRQLHRLNASKGGYRRDYGGMGSMGFRRGSIVKHSRYGVAYVGGTSNGRISLHSIKDGGRLTQNATPSNCKFLAYSSWRSVVA